MSTSKIEWTQRTWNPVTGCNKVSQGCKNCYAEVMHKRLQAMYPKKYSRPFLDGAFAHEPDLMLPLKWKEPAMIFVNSMSDLFHENISFDFIDKVFAVMALCNQHTFQILTKRPEIMWEYLHIDSEILLERWDDAAIELLSTMNMDWHGEFNFPLPNVWLGTSCEDQKTADERIPLIMQVPAAVRFLSCEPLIGPIDLIPPMDYPIPGTKNYEPPIQWVIAGGESGHDARYMHPDWVRDIRDQCESMKIPFFFKQWGEFLPLEEANQAPFWYFSNDPALIDGHAIEQIDPVTGEAGKYNGYHFEDPMQGVIFCVEHNALQCNFLRMGKKNAGNFLDGKQYQQIPKRNKLKMSEK